MFNFEIGKIYTFNTLAPAILSATVKNAKLISVLDYETSKTFINTDQIYRSVYPSLPANTPDSPESALYYRFLTESNVKIIIANQWIDDASVVIVEHVNIQININNAELGDITALRNLLVSSGYNEFVIKQV